MIGKKDGKIIGLRGIKRRIFMKVRKNILLCTLLLLSILMILFIIIKYNKSINDWYTNNNNLDAELKLHSPMKELTVNQMEVILKKITSVIIAETFLKENRESFTEQLRINETKQPTTSASLYHSLSLILKDSVTRIQYKDYIKCINSYRFIITKVSFFDYKTYLACMNSKGQIYFLDGYPWNDFGLLLKQQLRKVDDKNDAEELLKLFTWSYSDSLGSIINQQDSSTARKFTLTDKFIETDDSFVFYKTFKKYVAKESSKNVAVLKDAINYYEFTNVEIIIRKEGKLSFRVLSKRQLNVSEYE